MKKLKDYGNWLMRNRKEKKMNMMDWAKREIEIACKRENENIELDENGMPKEFDYGCACYGSALKAFKSLLEDGHSGMSIGFTKSILNRLIDGKPLTPIEDAEDIWNMIETNDKYTCYQCKRMSSLFKEVYKDGTVKYSDNDSFYCVDINNHNNTYHSGLVRKIVEELYPITMPYMPSNTPIKVYCEDLLTDKGNGDFDTVGVFYLVKDGEKVEINRFFDLSGSGTRKISKEEYDERKSRKI